MQGVHLRKYGAETKIPFELYEVDGVDLRTDAADGGTDCTIMKDEGAEATCTNDFVDEGLGYSLTLTATEMQGARIVVYIVDSATKVYLDKVIIIETYGHASAQHAMDFDDSVRAGLTALPNAAADAAGGLPISDAGGLDMDAGIAASRSRVTLTGTAAAGAATTITLTGGVATTGYYNGQLVVITAGKGIGQARQILSYDGGTAIATVTRDWTTAPDIGDSQFVVLAADVPTLLEAGTAVAGGNATITLDSAASGITGTYKSNYITITGGTGAGQTRLITAYVGGTQVATVTPNWTTNPAAGSVYQ
ncbi:MAG: hypothetical protein ACYTF6_13550, partial [Planctomycetota bacterium]